MVLNGGKALLADDVLNSAGIFGGYLGVDPQHDQKIGNQGMALINLVGDGLSCGEQRDGAFGADGDISVLPEVFHGYADAGFGESQLIGNVDGAHSALLIMKNQDRFQIVFGRFVYLQLSHHISFRQVSQLFLKLYHEIR